MDHLLRLCTVAHFTAIFPRLRKRARTLLTNSLALSALASGANAGTWNAAVTDNFTRANSAIVGNGWQDPEGVGSISANTLKLTVPSAPDSKGADIRVSRPTGEAGLYQRIEASFVIPSKTDGLSHSAYVRGKSIVLGGVEIFPVIMVNVRHSGVMTARLNYKGGAGFDLPITSTPASYSAAVVAGNSYTLAVQVTNNFPWALTATLTDNTAGGTLVGTIVCNDYGEYHSTLAKKHLSPDFVTDGVMGVAMEGGIGKSVSFTQVKTYAWSEGAGVPFSASVSPVSNQRDGKTFLASPYPSGGTPPYKVRWYRGSPGFTPPPNFDGTGGGTGVYLGNTFEAVDTSPPAGVTNSSIAYRAVYFDSGAYAATGVAGLAINRNSPTAKSYAVTFWIGDSITAGIGTSANNYSKSPAHLAQPYLTADSSFSALYTQPITGQSSNNYGLSGRTSTDFQQGRRPYIIGQTRLLGATLAGIMLGTNDSKDSIATTPATYKANIEALIAALKASRPDIQIVLNKPTWFKPDTGFSADFSANSLVRLSQYHSQLDQLASDPGIVVGGLTAYNEIQAYGWTGTSGQTNAANATTAYPPAPTGGKSYLVDGLHPYNGGAEMIAKLEWGPNAREAALGYFVSVPVVNAGVDATITLPVASVTLSGTATSASGAPLATYAWTKISGGAATLGSPTAATTSLTGLAAGTYIFRLIVSDSAGNSGFDEVKITVNP